MEKIELNGNYVAIKALSGGVQIIGLTRGNETKSHHIEKLDAGELLIAQFTENTSAIKVRGDAEVYTQFGVIKTFKNL